MRLAVKTMQAIEEGVRRDQGAAYRGWLEQVIPHIGDAYSTNTFPFRSHMGASGIGADCPRKPWYGFRWVTMPNHKGQLLRLFNRGHLEEARFVALLLMIGANVYQQDNNGKQFRISAAGGHFGGSGDGVVVNIPDLPQGMPALSEFKTANHAKFEKFKANGVRKTNHTYYVQMQTYMRKMGIPVSLFMVVNKNNDEIHAELVEFDPECADRYINRGEVLVFMDTPPARMNAASPGYFECKWCEHNPVCYGNKLPYRTCRSCVNALVGTDGKWYCHLQVYGCNHQLTQDQQLAACQYYNGINVV